MKVKTQLRTLHAINHQGITRLREILGNEEAFIDAVVMLEDVMDSGGQSAILDSHGVIHYFDSSDFDRTFVGSH
jgi:hypothetical protein